MVQENLLIQMGPLIMEHGKKIRLQDMVFLFILNNKDTKVNGNLIYKMDMEKNIFQMEVVIKANLRKD